METRKEHKMRFFFVVADTGAGEQIKGRFGSQAEAAKWAATYAAARVIWTRNRDKAFGQYAIGAKAPRRRAA